MRDGIDLNSDGMTDSGQVDTDGDGMTDNGQVDTDGDGMTDKKETKKSWTIIRANEPELSTSISNMEDAANYVDILVKDSIRLENKINSIKKIALGYKAEFFVAFEEKFNADCDLRIEDSNAETITVVEIGKEKKCNCPELKIIEGKIDLNNALLSHAKISEMLKNIFK